MAGQAAVPRVSTDGDDLDAVITPAPGDVELDAHGLMTLADVVLEARADTVATVRVHGTDDFHYAVIVMRGFTSELVHLDPVGDGVFATEIVLSAGELLHLTVVASDFETGMAYLEHVVAQGGMGGGGEEAAMAGDDGGTGAGDDMPVAADDPLPDLFPGAVIGGAVIGGVVIGGGVGPAAIPGGRAPRPGMQADGAAAAPPPAPAPPPPEPVPAVPTIAHVDAEMPPRAVHRQEVTVRVRLSRDPLTPTPGAAHDDAVISVDSTRPVTVTVMPRGLRFRPGVHATRKLRLPDPGKDPAIVDFRLIAVDIGQVEVSVIVRQDPIELPLATLRLTAEVTAGGRMRSTARPRRKRAAVAGRSAELAGLPTIRVDESIAGGKSTLRVAAAVGDDHAEFRAELGTKSRFVDNLYAQLRGIREHLEGVPEQDRPAEAEQKLAEVGSWLAGRVFGEDIRALLLRHQNELAGLIVQTSGEVDLPWEIVCLAPPAPGAKAVFLADAGLVRLVYDTAHPRRIAVAADRVVTVSPDYQERSLRLERTGEEIAALVARFSGVPPPLESRDQIAERLGERFDLLHFAGHGRWRAADPRCQELLLATFSELLAPDGSSFAETDARSALPDRGISDPDTEGPFVFLSACDVGRLQAGATGLGGFAEAFLRGGAGAFIGCSWAVRDDLASRFVTEFYRAAFDDGLPLAQATLVARTACRDAGELSALAFTVFADPRAKLTAV